MLSEAETTVSTERAHALAAAVAPPVWDLAVAGDLVVAAEADADELGRESRSTEMKSAYANNRFSGFAWVAGIAAWACLSVPVHLAAQPAAKEASTATAKSSPSQKTFDTQEQAAKAVVDAAGQFDTTTLIQIFGPGGDDVVFSGEVA